MCGLQALRIALDLRHVPSRVHHIRSEPLPPGVPFLLRIAAGDDEAERRATGLIDRPLADIRGAAAFFIEQILLAPDSSSYRVLGARPDATAAELRRNMALLMRWLHPDTDGREDRHLFAGRVASAWNDLKTPERRAMYDSRFAAVEHSARAHNGDPRSPKRSRKRRRYVGSRPGGMREKSQSLMPYSGEPADFLARMLSWLVRRT